MQWTQRRGTLSSLLLSSIMIVILAAAAFAAKEPKTYPEAGKITGTGRNEHSQTMGGGMINNGTGTINTSSLRVFTHLYTVQTDTKIYQLDCGSKKECGGDKKFEIGDVIHFRVENGKAYVSVVNGGNPGEQKLLVLNEQLRPDAKPADAPTDPKQ